METFEEWINRRGYEYNPIMGSVRPGWVPILDELCDKLEAAGWDKTIFQIKEKFGGLRFYIGEGTEEIFALITEAESKSFSTCQNCGKEGGQRTKNSGWAVTECDKCFL